MASIPRGPGNKEVSREQSSLNNTVTPLSKEKKITGAVEKSFGLLRRLFSSSSQPARPMTGRSVSHAMPNLSRSKSDMSNAPEEEFEMIDQKQVQSEMAQATAQKHHELRQRDIAYQLTNARQHPPDRDLRQFSSDPNKSNLAFCYKNHYFGLGIVRKNDQDELETLEKVASFCFIPLVNKGTDNELGIFCVASDKEVVEGWFSDKETTMQQMSNKTYKNVERSTEEYAESSKAEQDALERERLSQDLKPFLVKNK